MKSDTARKLAILFIEDSRRDFHLVELYLEQQGLQARCRQAADAGEIAAALGEGKWDVVLADYKVPGVAWKESLAAIRASQPEVPVILVSGAVGEEKAVELLKEGCADFVLKNNLARLLPAIERSRREAGERRARRAAEAALKASEEQLRRQAQTLEALLQAAPDAVVVVGQTGEIRMLNGQCEQMFGYRRDDLLGQPVEILLPERYRATHVAHRSHFWAQPRVRAMGAGLALWGRRRDGSEFPIEVSLSPITLPLGRAVHAAVRGASEQRRATESLQRYTVELEAAKARLEEEAAAHRQTEARLRQSNADLEEFAFLAAHDLQTPLRQVHSFANLLARNYRGQLDREAEEFINYIVGGSQHMADIVNDVLRFSRVRQQISLPDAPIDSELILEAALSRMRLPLAESGGAVEHDPLPAVTADPEQLGLVFENLVNNALKFRRKGVVPRVHVGAREGDGEWEFCVRDNGIGIAPQYQERIFRIFQRLHSPHEYPGSGMGLALCKRIVEQHGGHIRVESAEGQGAAFFFTLPQGAGAAREAGGEPASPAVAKPEALPPEKPPVEARRAKIVIADDRPVERDYLRTVLSYGGHEVLEAADGAQALALVRKEKPDLLVTDMMMPIMDGYALMQAIRADPEIAATPAIFCTATYRQPETKLLATAAGAARYLVKPVDPVMLLAVVQEVLRGEVQASLAKMPPAEVERAYLRLLNDKLLQKTDELEQEVAARARAEAELRRLYAERSGGA